MESRQAVRRAKRRVLTAAVLAGLGSAVSAARATTLFFDDNGAAGISNVNGTWNNLGNTNWNTASNGSGSNVQWDNSQNNDASFGAINATSATVTVSGAITANSLHFTNSTLFYNISQTGGGALTLTNGTIATDTATSSTTSYGLSVPITVPASGNLIIANNAATGSSSMSLQAAETMGDLSYASTVVNPTGRDQVSLNVTNALPATSVVRMNRYGAQLNFGSTVWDGATFSNNIILNEGNSAQSGFVNYIGANGSQVVTLNGTVTSNATGSNVSNLDFRTGASGGLGVIVFANPLSYNGTTTFLNGAATGNTGTIRNGTGADNFLPTTTTLIFGGTGTAGAGALDLNGRNQTVAGIQSGSGAISAIGGVTNTDATKTALNPCVFTINGTSTGTTYSGNIGIPPTNTVYQTGGGTLATNDHIKLVLHASNTGTTTFTRAGGMTYDGGTQIDGGALIVNNTSGSGTGSGSVSVGTGGKLGGTGIITGALSNSGKLLPGGAGAVGTLTLSGGASLAADSTIDMDFSGTGPNNDKINFTAGTLTLPGSGTVKIDLADLGSGIHNTTSANYVLFNYGGATLSGTPASAFQVIPPTTGGAQAATFGIVDNTGLSRIELTVTGAGNDVSWRGDGSGNGSWDTAPANMVWFNNTTSSASAFGTNDVVTFDDTANGGAGDMTVSVDAGGVSPSQVTVNSSRNITIQGGAINGNGKLNKSGTGRLLLTGSNTYTGGTTVTQGKLAITSDAALGAAPGSPTINLTVSKTASTNATFLQFEDDMSLNANRIIKLSQTGGSGPAFMVAAGKTVTINGNLTGSTGGVNLVVADTIDGTHTGTINLRGNNGTNVGGGFVNGMTVNIGTVNVIADQNFGSAGTGMQLNGGAGTLQFGGSFTWTGRPLTFGGSGGSIDTNSFNQTIDGVVGGSGPMTKKGAGTLTLTGNNTISGAVSVTDGSLVLTKSLTTSSGVSASNNATLKLASDGTFQRVIKTGTVAATTGGRIDIDNNKMIVTGMPVGAFNGSAYDGVTGLIAAGYSPSQDFSGSGIVTTQSNATGGNTLTNIGVASNTDLGLSTFGGVTVGANDALVMYTYGGDANLDGAITGDDYFQIDSGFPAGAHGWFNGDFNYDGSITGDDYFVIDSNFSAQGAPFPTGGGIAGVTAVPEPASISIFAISATALLARRRRR